MPLATLRERLGQEASCTTATEFSGYVKTLPSIRPTEKLVLSQVLVPPLVQEYVAVKKEWMKQKLWKQDDFVEVRDESCNEEMKPKIIEALHTFLEMRMDAHIKELKSKKDHNWKRLLVESFETTLSDPKVSSNVETYVVPDSDPVEALRGQLGLKTVMASDIFVIGVFRSRTMLDLPTYLEQERINSPPGFQKSPYWWGLEMDRYAADGSPYCPYWMSPPHTASKKKKCSTGKLSNWTEGYGMTYSAFGYGNETVLCNDPHLTPWTDLDDTEVNQQAEMKSNTSVRECRIGPWVFPIQVTMDFLPKGTPLLFYYGKGYWVTTRASQALATLTDEREARLRRDQEQTKRENEALKQNQEQLRRENDGLRRCLQILHQQHGGAALQLVQASLDAGRAIAALSPPDKPQQSPVKYDTPKPNTRQHSLSSLIPNMHANPVAVPASTLQGAGDINQSQPPPQNSIHATTASEQPAAANDLNSVMADDNAIGHLQAALGQSATNVPRAFPGKALPEVCSEVQYLRQSYGSLLQRMTTLEANLHGMEQQQPSPLDNSFLNQIESQHAQHDHAASPINVLDFVATKNQGELKTAAERLPTQMPNASLQQHSMPPPAVMDEAARQRRAKMDKRNECDARRKAASRAKGGATCTIADAAAFEAAAEAHKAQADARLSSHELASPVSAQAPASNAPTRASSQTPDALKALKRRQASRMPEQQAADASPVEAARARETLSKAPEAEQAGKKPSAVKNLWGALVGQQGEPSVQAAPAVDGQQAALLDNTSHAAAVLSRTETLIATEDRQKHKSVLPQAKTVAGQGQFQGAAKRSAGKGNNQQQKKRKVNETAATGTDSGSQPEAVATADTEAAAAVDRKAGELLEDVPVRWGGKQKRKHVRLGSADGPNQTRRAPQQKLLTPYFSPSVAQPSRQSAAASEAASTAAALDTQCDKPRRGMGQSPSGVCSAHGGANACFADGDDDEYAVPRDKGSEQLEQQIAELKDMALAAQQHKAAGALFAVLDEAEVPFDWDEQVVKRRIMAPQHDHSQMHLFAKDIQQACGGWWSCAPGHKHLLSLLHKAEAVSGPLPTGMSIANALLAVQYSNQSRWVVAAHGIKALLLPGVLQAAQRKRLHFFTSDMWSLGRPLAASSRPSTAQTSPGTGAHMAPMQPPSSPTAGVHPAGDQTAGVHIAENHIAEASAEGANTADAALPELHAICEPEHADSSSTLSGNTTSGDSSSEGHNAEASAEGGCTADAATLKLNAVSEAQQAQTPSNTGGNTTSSDGCGEAQTAEGASTADAATLELEAVSEAEQAQTQSTSSGNTTSSDSSFGEGHTAEVAAETEDAAVLKPNAISEPEQAQTSSVSRGSSSSSSSDNCSSEEEHSGKAASPVKSPCPQADGDTPDAETDDTELVASGTASLVAVLNTSETSLAVADSSLINVGLPDATPIMVQRHLIAAAGGSVHVYLPVEDALKACGIHQSGSLIQEVQQLLSSKAAAEDVSQAEALDVSMSGGEQEACGHAPPLDQAAQRAQCNIKAHMLAMVHCDGYSKPVLVLGALGVQALLKSPAMTEEARHRLARFMADLWTLEGRITHPAAQQRVGSRAPRAVDSSLEVEISTGRESDGRAGSSDQAGAEHSSPATSCPAASSPQAILMPEDQSPTQAEGGARCLEGLGTRACSDSQHRESGARCDSLAASLGEAMQAADEGHGHKAAAAASNPVPTSAAAHAVPVLAAADDAALAVAQRFFSASQHAGSQGQKLLPIADVSEPFQQTGSMSLAVGRPEAGRGGTAAQARTDPSGAKAEAVHASEVGVKPDTLASMSTAICSSHESPLGENRHGIMMGKRKRARKSTKSEHQPASSVQQSNAILLQNANTMPKTNNTALFNDSDHEAARDSSSNKLCADDEVIDLTSD